MYLLCEIDYHIEKIHLMRNLKFADDKILIQFINKKTLLNKGKVSILYRDILDMSEVKNKNKVLLIISSIALITLGFCFWLNFGIVLSSFGIPFLFFGCSLPPNYLRLQNRNKEVYLVNVSEYITKDLIDLIEEYRKF